MKKKLLKTLSKDEAANMPNIEQTHVLKKIQVHDGSLDYQVALREWLRNNKTEPRPFRSDFDCYEERWVPKRFCSCRGFTLKENAAGTLLLEVQEWGEAIMLKTGNPQAMGEYLHAAMDGMSLEGLRNMAKWGDEVDEGERLKLISPWTHEPIIATQLGMSHNEAGAAGLQALRIAGLHADPLAELERCSTAAEVRELVEEYESLVCPVPYTAAPHNAFARHKCAWQVCLLMRKLAKPQTFSEWQDLVSEWGEVCKTLVGAEYMSLDALKQLEDCSEGCAFEQADFIEFNCSRVSLRGAKPLNLAERLAHLLEGKLMDLSESDQDGDSEWFYFKKREK